MSIFEKKIEVQLDVSYDELHDQMPLEPKWGVKKNSEGKNVLRNVVLLNVSLDI